MMSWTFHDVKGIYVIRQLTEKLCHYIKVASGGEGHYATSQKDIYYLYGLLNQSFYRSCSELEGYRPGQVQLTPVDIHCQVQLTPMFSVPKGNALGGALV